MNPRGLNGVALRCVMTATFLAASHELEGSDVSRPGWLPQSGPKSLGNPGDSWSSGRGESAGPEVEEKAVHVGGQVRNSGPVDFKAGMTAEQAITAAGGATEFAALRRVEILRDGGAQTINMTTPEGRGVPLRKDDILTVPEKSCE